MKNYAIEERGYLFPYFTTQVERLRKALEDYEFYPCPEDWGGTVYSFIIDMADCCDMNETTTLEDISIKTFGEVETDLFKYLYIMGTGPCEFCGGDLEDYDILEGDDGPVNCEHSQCTNCKQISYE